jgi:hypothetical protein
VEEMFFYDRELPIFSVVLDCFYDFHVDTFISKGSAAINGYCGLLTTSANPDFCIYIYVFECNKVCLWLYSSSFYLIDAFRKIR